nr:PREDICTED: uncharacterized protein LOC106456429 [Pundamilia nyererei]
MRVCISLVLGALHPLIIDFLVTAVQLRPPQQLPTVRTAPPEPCCCAVSPLLREPEALRVGTVSLTTDTPSARASASSPQSSHRVRMEMTEAIDFETHTTSALLSSLRNAIQHAGGSTVGLMGSYRKETTSASSSPLATAGDVEHHGFELFSPSTATALNLNSESPSKETNTCFRLINNALKDYDLENKVRGDKPAALEAGTGVAEAPRNLTHVPEFRVEAAVTQPAALQAPAPSHVSAGGPEEPIQPPATLAGGPEEPVQSHALSAGEPEEPVQSHASSAGGPEKPGDPLIRLTLDSCAIGLQVGHLNYFAMNSFSAQIMNASTKLTHFIIGGFDTVKGPVAVGVVMLIIYLLAVTGSLVNILFIVSDKQLHKPMYLLICNLAVVDILYTSSATPTMIGVLLAGVNTISLGAAIEKALSPLSFLLDLGTSRISSSADLRDLGVILTKFGVVLTLEERQGLLIGTILGPSLVNPFVYCLRTKEIKNTIFKIRRKVNIAG